jgi:hypothetical protein
VTLYDLAVSCHKETAGGNTSLHRNKKGIGVTIG